MSKINKLYHEIENLNKKIEEESKQSLKRKYIIEDEIERLEGEVRLMGLRGDFSSVAQYKSKIAKLKQEMLTDRTLDFQSEIKLYQNKINKIIIEYYKKEILIEEIIKIEEISKSTLDYWFSLTNFGKNSGCLFVDEINSEDNCWIYFNPFTDVKLCSKTIEELLIKIKENDEIVVIFDQDLFNKSKSKDLLGFQKIINQNLRDLDNLDFDNGENIFIELNDNADKLNEAQISYLCEIMIENPELNKYLDYFNNILEVNEDKITNNEYIEQFFSNLINNGINKLDEVDSSFEKKDIFEKLKGCCEYFTIEQIDRLYNWIIKNNVITEYNPYLMTILEVNEIEFENQNFNRYYSEIIDYGINKLNESNGYCFFIRDTFKYLKSYSNKFSKSQLEKLISIMINNADFCCYVNDFKYILDSNSDILEYEDIYSKIIDNKLYFLKNYEDNNSVEDIMGDLKEFSNDFNRKQFADLCDIIIDNSKIVGFANKFKYILETNEYRYKEFVDYEKVYFDIIESRIKLLKEMELNNTISDILGDLNVFSNKFTDKQILSFCHVIKDGKLDQCVTYDLIQILEYNEDKINEQGIVKLNEIIIDYKLNELDNLYFGYWTSKRILYDLKDYNDDFSINQITRLCNISLTNSQVYGCDDCKSPLRRILNKNKEKIDKELYEKVILELGL